MIERRGGEATRTRMDTGQSSAIRRGRRVKGGGGIGGVGGVTTVSVSLSLGTAHEKER